MKTKSTWRLLLAGSAAAVIAMGGLELAARLAHSIGFAQTVQIDNERRETRPPDRLFNEPTSTFRILVLGDSMAYSPGLSSDAVWSTALETSLEQALEMNVEIVNAARGGDNTSGQLQFLKSTLEEHSDAAANAADLVLLLYNHNDVYGSRTPLSRAVSRAQPQVNLSPSAAPPARPERKQTLAQLARHLRQNSRFGELLLTRLGNQSRAWGYLVPGTEFHHLATKAYLPDSPGWLAVQAELTAMDSLISQTGGQFALFVLPQFASLQHDFFAQARTELAALATQLEITLGFGYPAFRDRTWQELAMSPFDGHPNEQANKEIAVVIQEWLIDSGLLNHRNPRNAR